MGCHLACRAPPNTPSTNCLLAQGMLSINRLWPRAFCPPTVFGPGLAFHQLPFGTSQFQGMSDLGLLWDQHSAPNSAAASHKSRSAQGIFIPITTLPTTKTADKQFAYKWCCTMALFLYGRAGRDAVEVTGDVTVLDDWQVILRF